MDTLIRIITHLSDHDQHAWCAPITRFGVDGDPGSVHRVVAGAYMPYLGSAVTVTVVQQ